VVGVALAESGDPLSGMPTTRPRHFVTETDDLAEALDEAARRWPNLSRAQLLVRLALEGHRAANRRRTNGVVAGSRPYGQPADASQGFTDPTT
jgi:hypothetical protein